MDKQERELLFRILLSIDSHLSGINAKLTVLQADSIDPANRMRFSAEFDAQEQEAVRKYRALASRFQAIFAEEETA